MTQTNTELLDRLVVGRSVDGRSRYDAQAKLQLVQACLKPGVSVANMALRYGINANLLRKWMTKAAGLNALVAPASAAIKTLGASNPFIAMQIEPDAGAQPASPAALSTTGAALRSANHAPSERTMPSTGPTLKRLQVRLPNGVTLDLGETGLDQLSSVVRMLSHLPCSN